ncbi:MAG: hypothetical protein RI993_1400 [Pseudomonadota bacterium]|jgi:2-polyprenyl-3-methyl-5-hydroxy-6-metoxy-1,4-benzoquinol methylase
MVNPSSRSPFEESWRKRFEKFAAKSDDDAGVAGWSPTGLETRLRCFVRLWKQNSDDKNRLWLDAGCGAGTYARYLTDQGMEVIGMDYSLPALQKASAKNAGDTIHWCAADVTKLPVKSGKFDGALCFGVTQALSQSNDAIAQLVACVKPGGEIWIDALNGKCLPHAWERFVLWLGKRPHHLRYESSGNLKQIMQTYQLTDITLFWLPMLPARWGRYQYLLETTGSRWIFQHIPVVGVLFSHALILRARRSQA